VSNVTLIKLPEFPDEVKISEDWYVSRDEVLALSTEVTVVDGDNYDRAAKHLKAVTASSNEVETLRKKLGKPYLDASKEIKRVSDEARAPLEDEKKRLKKMMGDYQMEVDRLRQEAERKAQEEAMAQADLDDILGEDESSTVDMRAQMPEKVAARGSSVSWVYDFEVINHHEIPREWLVLDEAAVRKHAREQKDNASIPGIKFTKRANVKAH